MIEDNTYKSPSIEGHETATKNRVVSYVESEMVEGQERLILSKIGNYLHLAVDYVMANLPNGVERVDGAVIDPILKEVIAEKLASLPVEEVEEELPVEEVEEELPVEEVEEPEEA